MSLSHFIFDVILKFLFKDLISLSILFDIFTLIRKTFIALFNHLPELIIFVNNLIIVQRIGNLIQSMLNIFLFLIKHIKDLGWLSVHIRHLFYYLILIPKRLFALSHYHFCFANVCTHT